MKTLFKISIYFTSVILLFTLLTGCTNEATETFTTLEELQYRRIGITLSAIQNQIANDRFPNANITEFNEQMDSITALQAGRVDAAMVSYPTAFLVRKNIPELTWIEEFVSHEQAGVGVRRGNTELLDEINAVIDELKENGILEDMIGRWYNMENPNYIMPDIPLPTEGTPLRVGVSADREPSTFLAPNGDVIGLDAELAKRIAKHLNRPIEFIDMRMASFALSLDSGQVDMVASNFLITDILQEMVYFSQAYFDTPFIMIVRRGR